MADDEIDWEDARQTRKKQSAVRDVIVSQEHADYLERNHHCTGLADVLMTDARPFFTAGWKFWKVFKGAKESLPEETRWWEYMTLPIENEWDDKAVFRRKPSTASDAAASNIVPDEASDDDSVEPDTGRAITTATADTVATANIVEKNYFDVLAESED